MSDPKGRPSNAQSSERETLTDQAYRLLRHEIVCGAFAAGQALRLESLKERYGLSFSPLREALNRLQSEKLVVASALRGFRVAEISSKEMWDLIETRILIESEALRRAMASGHDDWEARIVASFHSLGKCAERLAKAEHEASGPEADDLEERHREFHFAVIDACGSPSLLHIAAQLYAQTERYRRPILAGQWRSYSRDVQREHGEIMQAVLARDPSAVECLAKHYRRTGEAIEKSLLERVQAAE